MIVHHESNRLSEMERDLEGERRKSISLQESLKESEKELARVQAKQQAEEAEKMARQRRAEARMKKEEDEREKREKAREQRRLEREERERRREELVEREATRWVSAQLHLHVYSLIYSVGQKRGLQTWTSLHRPLVQRNPRPRNPHERKNPVTGGWLVRSVDGVARTWYV